MNFACKIVAAAAVLFAYVSGLSHAASLSLGGWTAMEPATGIIQFHIALRHAYPNAIVDKLFDVSDPSSANYGKHWNREELMRHAQPVDGAAKRVTNWLHAADIIDVTNNWCGDILTVRAPAEHVSRLFSLDLHRFSHRDVNTTIVRATNLWTLPTSVAADIHTLFGLHGFPVPRASALPTIFCIHTGVTDSFSGNTNASQALAEFQLQAYSPKDLAAFLNEFNLPSQTVRNVTGSGQSAIGHTEANLDVQYIMAMGSLIPTDFYLQKGMDFDLLAWSQDVAANPSSALVWSVSYGEDIETIVSSFDSTYPSRFNTEVAKLGTLGISVLFASGDSGVYSRQSPIFLLTFLQLTSILIQIVNEAVDKEFRPDFPASLPAITGVGATTLNFDGSEDTGTSFSGGGFCLSQFFSRNQSCSYQNAAVNRFFATSSNLPPSKLYDSKGCGYPDVSAQGENFEVVVNGLTMPVSGTSASCPTVAGIVALLNDIRLKNNKPPLGWLNPLFYAHPEVFNDMTKGTNKGSGIYGFTATTGWDPVTGVENSFDNCRSSRKSYMR
eukprot:gene6813-386_t